ncbi:hypothetical protein [Sphingomonas asaccharolytica]|uniref:hypothetical protein n=1 Tax=Sphingomonas asaccharolytica TaxID=40681 RepID=UPI000835C1A7|nr:hypothetical protein [Sphingomonas asaccharolytica]
MDNPYWVRAYEAEDGSGRIAGYVVERAGQTGNPELDSNYTAGPIDDASARNAALAAAEARRDELNGGPG